MNLTETLLTPLLRDLAPDVARRLGMIVAGLIAVVARRFVRMPHLAALALPLWNRLTRGVRRFELVMANLAAGRAPRPGRAGRREPAPDHDQPAENRPPPSRDPLPRGRAWLVRELGWEAAGFGSQLEHMLREPEIAALLAASPAACRILRPLCRMLAVHDDALPPAPRRARAAAPAPAVAPAAPPRPRQRVRRESAAHPATVATPPAPWDGPLPEAPPDPYCFAMNAFVR
jgi:hypothetical protein